MLDPHGPPRGVQYSERLAVPAALQGRLWTGDGYSDRLIYAHTLSHQAQAGVVGRLFRAGLADPTTEEFGAALWEAGERVTGQNCERRVLRWHARQKFCSQRCRKLWLLRNPQYAPPVLAAVAARAVVKAARR